MRAWRRGLRASAVTGMAAAMAAGTLALGAPASAETFLDEDNPCPEAEAQAAAFADAAEIPEVHRAAVDCAAALGIVRGREEGQELFMRPLEPVLRDQMASFIVRTLDAAGYDLPAPADQGFGDVAGNVHADAINQLKQLGIALGKTPDQYDPEERVTRGQMASFLIRAANFAFEGDDLAAGRVGSMQFPDVEGNVHEANIEAAAELLELAQGFEDGLYRPQASTTRAQMASFLIRLHDLILIPEPR
jgi:hypothetical protein